MKTAEVAQASRDVLETVQNVKKASEVVQTIDPQAALIALGLGFLGAAFQLPKPQEPKVIENV